MSTPNVTLHYTDNPLVGFCHLWCGTGLFPQVSDDILRGFQNPDIFALRQATLTDKTDIFKKYQSLLARTYTGELQHISDFLAAVQKSFPKDAATLTPALTRGFQAYQACTRSGADETRKIQAFLTQDTATPAKAALLTGLSRFFNLQGATIPYTIMPFPGAKDKDGESIGPAGVRIAYSLTQDEPTDKYHTGTLLLKRKSSTLYHESCHWMLDNSPLMTDIKSGTHPAMKHFMDTLSAHFARQAGQTDPVAGRGRALHALHEGLASAVSARIDELNGQTIGPDRTFYTGFPEADRLGQTLFPMLKTYLSQGKTLDDAFFQQLNTHLGDLTRTEHTPVESRPDKTLSQRLRAAAHPQRPSPIQTETKSLLYRPDRQGR